MRKYEFRSITDEKPYLDRLGKRYGLDDREVLHRYGLSPFFCKLPLGRERLDALLVNLKHGKKWLALPAEKVGGFLLVPGSSRHGEAPHALLVKDPEGKIVATAGFYVKRDGKRAVMVVSNVQGARKSAKELESLSRELGANWRSMLVGRLAGFAKAQEMRVEAETPPESILMGGKKSYSRIRRQYAQTFHKAGFKMEGGVWKLP